MGLNCLISRSSFRYNFEDDGLNEYLLNTSAPANYDEGAAYSDLYSWLMILDNKLEFLFPPVRFAKFPSRLQVMPLKINGKTQLLMFQDYFGSEDIKSAFYLFDIKGTRISERKVEEYDRTFAEVFPNPDEKRGTFFFLRNRNCDVEEIDSGFNILRKFNIPGNESCIPIAFIDADLDGKKEYIFTGSGTRYLIFTRDDVSHPARINLEGNGEVMNTSVVEDKGKYPELFLQFSDFGIFLKYSKKPIYPLRYLFYVILYLFVFLFIIVISKIQGYRLDLKLQTEKNKADYIFAKYARLIRQTVISSDQIVISLAEELDFVRNYVDLERFRSNNSFNFSMIIGSEVDTSLKIPRMLIHTFAENAVK